MILGDDESSQVVAPTTPPSTPRNIAPSSVCITPGKSPGKRRSRTAYTERLIRANQLRIESKFEGCTTKEQVVKRIIRYQNELLFVPLTLPSVSSAQLSKDFQRERVLLNGVAFIPDRQDTYRNNSFVATLNMLISRLVAREGMHCITPVREVNASSSSTGVVVPHEPGPVNSHPPAHVPTIDSITNIILQRASRTGCGSDSFFMVQKLFCIEGTFVTQRVEATDEPIKVHVFIDRKMHAPDSKSTKDAASSRAEEFHQQYVYNANQVGSRHIRSPTGSTGVFTNIASTLEKLKQPPLSQSKTTSSESFYSDTGAGGISASASATTDAETHAKVHVRRPLSTGLFMGSPRPPSLGGAPRPGRFTPVMGVTADESDSVVTATPPLEEDLGGGLCCIVTVANNFNIADVSCIEEVTEDRGPDVWLTVSTVVTDESNFKTGHFSRHVSLTVSTPYGSGSRIIQRSATLKQELLDTRHILHSMLHSRNVSRATEAADMSDGSLDSSSEEEAYT